MGHFQVTLDLDKIGDKALEGVKRFMEMIKISKEYNLVSKQIKIRETNQLCD